MLPTMWKVIDGLYIATNADASDLPTLQSAQISHIVNCAVELPDHHRDRFTYLRLNLRDPDDSLAARIATACDFIDDGRNAGNVMVHCNGAVSRSPAIVLSYLCHCGRSLQDSARHLASILPTRPNQVFLHQIADYFGRPLDANTIRTIIAVLGDNSNVE